MQTIVPRLPSTASLMTLAAIGLVGLLGLAGCASQSPDPEASTLAGVNAGSLTAPAAAAATPGLARMMRGGPYMFSLDESDVATMWRTRCAKEGAGDAAKAEACYSAVREDGAHEGLRFALDAQRRIVWTSFGRDDADPSREAIFLEGPLSVTTDGEHAVVATFAAVPHGTQMAGKTTRPSKPMRFDFTDDRTLVMTDEIKGRLVFHTTP